MSGRQTSSRAQKSANFILLAGSGRLVDDGRPVLHGGPDVRKNAGCLVGRGQREISDPGRDFGRKLGILGSKLRRFR